MLWISITLSTISCLMPWIYYWRTLKKESEDDRIFKKSMDSMLKVFREQEESYK